VRRRIKSPASAAAPDINVTPLVDVVLVLLIIFMVVAPRMEQDVPVELPGIFNPDPDVKAAVDPIKVTVVKAGEYYVNDQKYDLDAAIDTLALEHNLDPHRRLVLRADANLTYGDVRQILARSREIGFPGMSLLVGERHKPGSRAEPQEQESADAGEASAQVQLGLVKSAG
jgi:biopolymer transport protein TolR